MPAPKKRKPRARRSSPAARPRLPQLEQRHLDLIGLGMVAAAVFFAFLIYLEWDGGEAGGWAVDGLRRLIGAVYLVVPAGLLAARRDPGPARDAARRAAVPVRRALPVPGFDARPGGGHARARPGRRGGALGPRLGAPARRAGGGGAVLGDLDRARGGRRPHRGAVPVPGRRAAADRRLGRGRGEGDDRLVHQVGVARAGGGPAAARDRGAGRAGGWRAARVARYSAGGHRGVGGGRAGAVRAPRAGGRTSPRSGRSPRGSPRTRRPTSRASPGRRPISRRRAATGRRSPTRPTSSGRCRRRRV